VRRFRALGALVIGGAVVFAACGGGGADAPDGSRSIRVPGPDGAELSARVAGAGPVTLVLAHGAGTDMSSWYAAMDDFAGAGYRVIAFDARGVGDSEGAFTTGPAARAEDIEAVVRDARRKGAEQVVVMGSSLGSAAMFEAAAKDELAAVVGVSPASIPTIAGTVTEPGFFVASRGDTGPAANARELGEAFDHPARIVDGSIHGADLFADHPEAIRAVLAFLAGTVPAHG
jgi:pimeloyl-ACP methyl ester carboxylesterase